MTALITELIDKQDNFEIIGAQIAAILVVETANQVLLAAAEPDPQEWNLRIFSERANPWEQFQNDPDPDNRAPIVNVWYDSGTFDGGASNISERQKCTGTYHIDMYGYGVSSDEATGGHNPGDKEAALEVHRAIRLVRNILMSAQYTYLQLRPLIWKRWTQNITVFQPQMQGQTVQNIRGARLSFEVGFNELSPQIVPETLELISVEVKRSGTGEIYLLADYPETP